MCPLMPRVTTRTYNAHTRQIQLTHRWVHSCREGQQVHVMQTQGRYNHLTDGSTQAKSDDKSIESKCEADNPIHRWVNSCRERQQEHITHTRGRYSSLTDGSIHVESDNKSIQCKCEEDTAHSQMGPLMPRGTTGTYNAHTRQIQPTHRWVHSCREGQQVHIMQTQGRYGQLTDGFAHAESDSKNI